MNTVTKEEKTFETAEGRKWLQDMLRMGPVTITFTKKDGDERVMTCTLQEDAIPADQRPKPLAEGMASSCSVHVITRSSPSYKKMPFQLINALSL